MAGWAEAALGREEGAMVKSGAATVEEYLAELPGERRDALEAVRRVVLEHLPEGYEECMQFGMIGYVVPLSRYGVTYNGQALQLAALASQKRYMALYLNTVYADAERHERFVSAYRATGRRLDMGKSCVRFRRLEDLPLELVGETIASVGVDEFLGFYESARREAKGR